MGRFGGAAKGFPIVCVQPVQAATGGGRREVMGGAAPGATMDQATKPVMNTSAKMEFHVVSARLSAQASEAHCRQAAARLDTDVAGNPLASNAAELLAALSAGIGKVEGIDRVTPLCEFQRRGVEVQVHGMRQDVPRRLEAISCEIDVDRDQPERRLAPMHGNVRNFDTVFDTVTPGTTLGGVPRRKGDAR